MAIDDFFQVTAELVIQCYSGAAILENSERFGKQAGTDCITGQQLGNDAGIRFDENFIAIRGTSHEPVEIVCRVSTRDVNDSHATMIHRCAARSASGVPD